MTAVFDYSNDRMRRLLRAAMPVTPMTRALRLFPLSRSSLLPIAEGSVYIGYAGSVLSVSPASLTFDSSNWSTPQTFTVSTHDAELGLEELISHGVESDDLDYSTNYWFQGPGIDDDRLIGVSVSAGGL